MKHTHQISLQSFESFVSHEWIEKIRERYRRDASTATHAVERAIADLQAINKEFEAENGRVAFTSADGRVKKEDSFLRKLYKHCKHNGVNTGVTQKTLEKEYEQINDLC